MTIEIRKPYERTRVFTELSTEMLTQQSHGDSSDINAIVARFQRTGEMPPNPRGQEGQYVDCTPFSENITESYNRSIETLDEAGRLLSEREREQAEKAAAEQKELDELRQYKAQHSQPPKAEGASPPSDAAT